MTVRTTDDVTKALGALGWKPRDAATTTRAVADFQLGFMLDDVLLADGKPGKRTKAALTLSLDALRGKRGTASPHFSFSEFRCRCGGRYAGCAVIRVHNDLLWGLERYRLIVPDRDVTIINGYRCPTRNAQVGGASLSQHIYGGAADIDKEVPYAAVARLRAFAGLGISKSTKLVRHVDRRDVTGVNPTGGTVSRPTTWVYES